MLAQVVPFSIVKLRQTGSLLVYRKQMALEMRKLLKRGSFTSVEDLKAKVLAFVEYFNRTMAKPFKWTYKGKALAA
jgi:hypothetical protein